MNGEAVEMVGSANPPYVLNTAEFHLHTVILPLSISAGLPNPHRKWSASDALPAHPASPRFIDRRPEGTPLAKAFGKIGQPVQGPAGTGNPVEAAGDTPRVAAEGKARQVALGGVR